ncbi:DUF3618 domain-containing protein [Thalassococcus sp. S3]|uniref:DUF3618 domain-containing protein n=1 Tax=Thalassococcus sp. S3 TaxID=2017482 RepID=UPI001024841E|nr:DUF3618 domain-containing protein [Thalassococcus sp. S3]QBF33310.1 hypothetical protein CFI11_19095 [Thalassococcus sp. S3]
MTNETRSPEEIEREIEEQRSDLSSNIEDLQDKFSIDTLVRQIGDQFREHGGEMGRAISNQVKANPIPLALTGIGLAWLMIGGSSRPQPRHDVYHDSDRRAYSAAERDFRQTREVQGRPYTPPTYPPQTTAGPSWASEDHAGPTVGERLADGTETIKEKASGGAQSVKAGVSGAGSAVGDAAASAKASVALTAQSVRDGLSAAGSRIAEGTETLSEEGRRRVIAARRRAVEMRQFAARSMGDGSDRVADFYDRQPLVMGALALAVGAAIGGALPRTKTEDDLMGSRSDSLFDEAERIFEEEKAKAASVAASVQEEVQAIADETRADLDNDAPGDKSAVQAVGDKAKSTAKRVADKAKSEAIDKNLGKPKS